MKSFKLILGFMLLCAAGAQAQNVGVNADGSTPDNSAMLDVKSTSKGVLVPRMTTAQRVAITSPAGGLLVYQTDSPIGFYYNRGTSSSPNWQILAGNAPEGVPTIFTATRNMNNTIQFVSPTSSGNSSSTNELGQNGVFSLLPVACTAKSLYVFNNSIGTVTITLRVGSTLSNFQNTALTVSVGPGASGSVSANVAIPANSFIIFATSSSTTTAGLVSTVLTF